jgi:hypothetical protein
MSSCSMEDLVSQAEESGVTLAQVISAKLSANELNNLQDELRARIEDGYRSIAGFMEGVDVSSCVDFSSLPEDELAEMQHNIEAALSDSPLC